MTDREYKEYIEYRSAEFEKDVNATFDYLKRNIEINEQIRKERENILLYLHSRKPRLHQLKIFDDSYWKNTDTNINLNTNNYSIRIPSGLWEVK